MRRSLFAVLAAVALTACESGRVTEGSAAVDVRFAITREAQGPEAAGILPFTPQVSVRPGQIDVTGQVRTPDPCYTVSSRVRAEGDTITLAVQLARTDGICAQVLVVRDYAASVRNVRAGAYLLRVVHVYSQGGGREEVVHEQRLSVP